MRTFVAVGMAVTILFAGLIAASTAADRTEDAAVQNGTDASADAWNLTTGVADGIGEALGPGVVWMGVGAVIVGALGVLVSAGRRGR